MGGHDGDGWSDWGGSCFSSISEDFPDPRQAGKVVYPLAACRLARREERLRRIAEAKAKIEARAAERLAREEAKYEAKLEAREEKAKATGRKPGGKPPQPPTPGPDPKDQINLTDGESRIMPVAGGGFEQAYNAQAAVAIGSMLVVVNDVVQAANDKQQIAPTVESLGRLPEALGRPGPFWGTTATSAKPM